MFISLPEDEDRTCPRDAGFYLLFIIFIAAISFKTQDGGESPRRKYLITRHNLRKES